MFNMKNVLFLPETMVLILDNDRTVNNVNYGKTGSPRRKR